MPVAVALCGRPLNLDISVDAGKRCGSGLGAETPIRYSGRVRIIHLKGIVMTDVVIQTGSVEQVALDLFRISCGYESVESVDQALALYRRCLAVTRGCEDPK